MKAKTVFAFSMLVIFSIGGLAQNQTSPLKSAYIPPSVEEIKNLNSRSPLQIMDENPEWELSDAAITRLKSALISKTFIEKLDSMNEYSWNFDSIGRWKNTGSEYYLFDALGRNYSFWDTWYNEQILRIVPGNKTKVEWNSNYQITGIEESGWNGEYWESSSQKLYGYDDNARLVITTSSYYDLAYDVWIYNSSDTTEYNNDGLISKITSYSWDDTYKYWLPQYKNEYTYHPDGLPEMMKNYSWQGDTSGWWRENTLSDYYYDELRRDTAIFGFYWMGEGYNETFRQFKKYDAKNRLTEDATYFWNGEMRWWDGSSKYDYKYDGNNRLTETVSYGWDWIVRDWFINSKEEKTWDANSNLVEDVNFQYDTSTTKYTESWKETYNYDISREIADIAMPFFWFMAFGEEPVDTESHQNKVTSVIESTWNIELKKWDPVNLDSVYYSEMFNSPVDEANCKANFDWTIGKTLMDVSFINSSDREVVAWYWMFGDGYTSTEENPIHIYKEPGTYRVLLTTIDERGFCSNTMVKQLMVGIPVCQAKFSTLVDTVKQVVSLTNTSSGNNLKYFWSFGDGSMSKAINPVHTYEYPGSYPITLAVANDLGNCMDLFTTMIKVGSNPCNTDFVGYVDSSSNTVMLRAKKKNPLNNYRWILGDGTVGFGANKVHTFSHPGYYSASLTVSNKLAGCMESRKESFLVGRMNPGGQARYIYLGTEANTIAFTNKSLGSNLSYFWDFNDTETSTEKNPVHKYALPGYYDVCLTVTTKDGLQNTYCQKIFAGEEVKDHCLAKFEYNFSEEDDLIIFCTDRSFGEPDTWSWMYNGMDPSTLQNPDWTASAPGFVKIWQSIKNSKNGCVDDAFAVVNMGAKSRLKAAFGYIIRTDNNKADTYPIDFIGVSLGDAGKLKWSFGDGTYDSTSMNPVHYYQSPGTYKVCLTITNGSTGEEDTSCEWVTVGQTSREKVSEQNDGLKSWPNPFSKSAQVEIQLNANSNIDLSVYDLVGRKVRTIANEYRPAGTHSFNLSGSGLEAGNYYLILETASGRARQIISIIK